MPAAALRIETLTGAALLSHLPTLASLRMSVFREFPYLYDGDAAQENDQIGPFGRSPRAGLVVAFDGDEPVGCSTCVPAEDEDPAVLAPLAAREVNPARAFYFGESVLLPGYRGRGAGVAFFTEREAHVRRVSCCDIAFFASVRRPPDHPLRPAGYVPLADFWRRRGYAPWPGPPLVYRWRQVDGPEIVTNELDLWMKRL